MCRKIKKSAWYTEEELSEKKLDYKFLELLVLFESESDISDRLRKAGITSKKYVDYFVEHLRPLLENPSKYLATYLKRIIHPALEEEKMSPEMEAFVSNAQERAQMSSSWTSPRSQRNEDRTVETPVPQPHLRCPCYLPRTYSPVVPKEEERAVEMQKTNLHYQQQILGIKKEQELHCSLEHIIPGYQRGASREQLPPRPSSAGPLMLEVPRGSRAFERLSTPKKRLPSQSPCHALSCDSYGQGIPTKKRLGETSRVAFERAKNLQRKEVKKYIRLH